MSTVALPLLVVLGACSHSGPYGGADPGDYAAPSSLGDGDCSVEIVNLSNRPLESYFYLGLRNPPRLTAGWPRLGVLEPGQSSVVRGECALRRITVHAYATGPVDLSREYRSLRTERALVKGRREIIRLRLRRGAEDPAGDT